MAAPSPSATRSARRGRGFWSRSSTRCSAATPRRGSRRSASAAAGVKQVEAALGPVDVLVNNAGITRDGMFHKMTYEQWSAVLRTNLDSMFAMTRPVIEGMRERGTGRIVNISSINGQKGQIGQV